MAESTCARWGGLALLLAGGLWVAGSFVADAASAMQAAALALSLGGVAALLARRAGSLSRLGLAAAWLLAVATVMTLAGVTMFLRLPWSLPTWLGASFVPGLMLLALSLCLLAAVGWRRRFLPRWATAAMLIGALGPLLLWAGMWTVEAPIVGRTLVDLLLALFPDGLQPLWAGAGVAWLALGAGLWISARMPSERRPVTAA